MPLPQPFPSIAGDEASSTSRFLRIFTIGHSNQTATAFLALLRLHGLRILVDVRSAPYSRHAPHFNRGALAALLGTTEIRYVWAGDVLGGRPDDPACYHDRQQRIGNVDYAVVARQPWFQAGLAALLEHAASAQTAVMCSEEEPRRCHRHMLIEPALRERGVEVLHVRRDGTVETIDPRETSLAHAPGPQLALAGFAA